MPRFWSWVGRASGICRALGCEALFSFRASGLLALNLRPQIRNPKPQTRPSTLNPKLRVQSPLCFGQGSYEEVLRGQLATLHATLLQHHNVKLLGFWGFRVQGLGFGV